MKKYIVYKLRSKLDRANGNKYVFYGWTNSKPVVKAFTHQRGLKKYHVISIDSNDIPTNLMDIIDDSRYMIDYVELRSVSTDEKVKLFITQEELIECEINIQNMFIDKASLGNIDGNGPYLNMFMALDNYYADALYYIGLRPKEIDMMFDSADPGDEYSMIDCIEDVISEAYDGCSTVYEEANVKHNLEVRGIYSAMDVANKLYYSLESFVKVLVEKL